MTDTNGNVAADHLAYYQGVPVSAAILADLKTAGDEFRTSGYTFTIVLPEGGYRSFDIQGQMRADYLAGNYARFNLAPPPSPVPAVAGLSRHGFGRAIDVASSAPLATRDAILKKHGFNLWTTADRNHYEWGNALQAADVSSIPLNNSSIGERDMLGIGMSSVGASFTLTSTGRLIHHIIEKDANGAPYPRETTLVGSALQQPGGNMWVESDDDFARLLWSVGRFDLGNAAGIQMIKDTIKANPGHVFEPPAITLTDAQAAAIAAQVKVTAGPVTVNAQVDVTPELKVALQDPTVLATLQTAIKVPTKIEATLS